MLAASVNMSGLVPAQGDNIFCSGSLPSSVARTLTVNTQESNVCGFFLGGEGVIPKCLTIYIFIDTFYMKKGMNTHFKLIVI